MKIDLVNILITEMSGIPFEGIDDELIRKNRKALLQLKKDLGIAQKYTFLLILQNDDIHTQVEVIDALQSVGCGEDSVKLMMQAETEGSSVVAQGLWKDVKPKEQELINSKFDVELRKIRVDDKKQ